MTLIEMMMALTVFSVIMGGAVAFLRSQTRGIAIGSDRMGVLQNLRYAVGVLAKDLRTAGSGVPDKQPYLVYAGTDAIAFNADQTTNDSNDPWAVYYDPDASAANVGALEKTQRAALPGTGFAYPDTSYLSGGINSPAETITLYFAPDSSTSRTDDYILYRQVNQNAAEVVSRNLLHTGATPFFQYYSLVTPVNAAQQITPTPPAWLPLTHSVPIHLALADTDVVARIDSVRGVRVNMSATNGKTGADERTRAISRLIWMPNAGQANRKTCGDVPILGSVLFAAANGVVNGAKVVNLTWVRATDETGGEKDVERYVVWRRLQADVDWGDPYVALPAGLVNYSYTDGVVVSGQTYMYALAAQDCTPSLSSLSTAGPITIP